MAKIHELLRGPENWRKGAIGSMDGDCHCAYGWLQKAYYFPFRGVGRTTATDTLNAAAAKVHAVIGEKTGIARWNDAPERTFEEVKALFVKLDL